LWLPAYGQHRPDHHTAWPICSVTPLRSDTAAEANFVQVRRGARLTLRRFHRFRAASPMRSGFKALEATRLAGSQKYPAHSSQLFPRCKPKLWSKLPRSVKPSSLESDGRIRRETASRPRNQSRAPWLLVFLGSRCRPLIYENIRELLNRASLPRRNGRGFVPRVEASTAAGTCLAPRRRHTR